MFGHYKRVLDNANVKQIKQCYIVMRPLGNPRVNDGLKLLKNTPLIGGNASEISKTTSLSIIT